MALSPPELLAMRTTVELPPDLMREAKTRAAERGESLKVLLTRAVASELGRSVHARETGVRVRLPLFGDPHGKSADISSETIARALALDDVSLAHRAIHRRKK